MPGLPNPVFRMVNAEPGGGKPSPYNSVTTQGQASRVAHTQLSTVCGLTSSTAALNRFHES
jgi:hypothetical protein